MTKSERNRQHPAARSALILTPLLILPALAVIQLSKTIPAYGLGAYLLLISTITLCAYRADKQKAAAGSWRIPERVLHLLELFGGWIAALFAQRLFRHKIAKLKYQITFWLIILLHQYAAFDYLNHGRYTAALFHLISAG